MLNIEYWKNITEYVLCHLRHSSSSWVRTSLVMLPTVEITPLPIRDMLTNHSAASTSWPITDQLPPLGQSQHSSVLMRTSITSWCVECYTSVQYSPRGSSKTTSATQTCSHLMRCHWSCHCNISTVNTTFLFSFSEKDIFSLDVRLKYDHCGCVKRCLELYFHHRCWKFWGRHNFC